MTQEPNFDVSKEDFQTIMAIIARLESHFKHDINRVKMSMDISAAHNSNPLKLVALLEASPADFAHDIFGIQNNINRETGELENMFSPRYSVK